MTYKLTHDPLSGAIYIRLREGEYEETLDFGNPGGGVNVDIDREGYVLGLEFLSFEDYVGLMERHDGQVLLPERIEDPANFSLELVKAS
ncbi:MAG: DUF2283 domain-containing protein [Actinomycetota bacterium]|nr:DUF2283 domain-containing protein [Actinomycetota bacterium]